jgi:hypothetical protein
VHATFFGPRVGLDDAVVDGTVLRPANDPAWTDDDALLVALVDALHDHADVPDFLWMRAAQRWSKAQLVELTMLAGQYRMISGMVKAWRLAPEPFARRFPQA